MNNSRTIECNGESTYADKVANTFMELIENGTAPWLKPWKENELSLPYNSISGRKYNGFNSLWLSIEAEKKGYDDPRWMTFLQAKSLAEKEKPVYVKKNEKAITIRFVEYKKTNKEIDENIEEDKVVAVKLAKPIVKYFNVFNVSQIEGIEPLHIYVREWESNKKAESIINEIEKKIGKEFIIHDRTRDAYYERETDTIHLPKKERFHTQGDYYATLFHELGHWTGNIGRIDRYIDSNNKEMYAREELRAEIASYMIAQEIGIPHNPSNHAAYISSWIKILKENRNEVFQATADAAKIKNYIIACEKPRSLGKREEETLEHER